MYKPRMVQILGLNFHVIGKFVDEKLIDAFQSLIFDNLV